MGGFAAAVRSRTIDTMRIEPGRFTADVDGEFVVFLIGMRFNHPLAVRQWLPVVRAMPAMMRLLDDDPDLGMLGQHAWYGRTTLLVQYWRDFDALSRFARDDALPHLEPWRRFNRAARASTAVGVWHETFRVQAGQYEAIYANMPAFGLAAATAHVPVGRRGQSAAERLGVVPGVVSPR